MKNKDLISILDLGEAEILSIFQAAEELKQGRDKNKLPLAGKIIGMIFQKPSTRTRVSFEVGIYQLGGFPIFLNANELQLKRGESMKDTARVLSSYLDGMVIRAYAHKDVMELASYSTISVINGLTDLLHPCQIISDVFTIMESRQINRTNPKLSDFSNIKIVYVGDGNNVANSWMEMAVKLGMKLIVCTPQGYETDKKILSHCLKLSKKTGARIEISSNPGMAVKGADVIYTDVWESMGNEAGRKINKKAFRDFQLNQRLLACAKKGVIIMHCLPAHRGEEITDEVMDGPNSVIFNQAENRLHVQKAIMKLLIK